MTRLLIRLYPRAWRRRYGSEVLVHYGCGRLGVRDTLDLLGGALDAHLHPQWARRGRTWPWTFFLAAAGTACLWLATAAFPVESVLERYGSEAELELLGLALSGGGLAIGLAGLATRSRILSTFGALMAMRLLIDAVALPALANRHVLPVTSGYPWLLASSLAIGWSALVAAATRRLWPIPVGLGLGLFLEVLLTSDISLAAWLGRNAGLNGPILLRWVAFSAWAAIVAALATPSRQRRPGSWPPDDPAAGARIPREPYDPDPEPLEAVGQVWRRP